MSEDQMKSLRGLVSWVFAFGLTLGTIIHRADVMTPAWWTLNGFFLVVCGIGVVICYRGVYRA